MEKLKISMLGAGSGFTLSIIKELIEYELFEGCEFVLMDTLQDRVDAAEDAVMDINKDRKINVVATTSLDKALEGCDYVVSSCEVDRYPNRVKDLLIPTRHGVNQVQGENGGPGGLAHALRNIQIYREIVEKMEKYCPEAWLMNFTNPMSILCTYFKNYSSINALGFCHQVHGSFGLIAELLGMEPGELEVFSGGINHLNWLFDIRKKGSGESCMEEFFAKVRVSKYWKKHFDNIPEQTFTLETLNTFNMYPIGYDDHIIEYLPFFWEDDEWGKYGFKNKAGAFEELANREHKNLEVQRLLGRTYVTPPFPVNPDHPYYAEKPCQVIVALETNTPTYFDAINIVNNGAISNLPSDAILDIPGIAIGGKVRSIHVGELPMGPMEICRRQVTLHEMIAKAAHEGDNNLIIQALCLDPYVHSLSQARNIWADFRKEFKDFLGNF